MSKLYGAIFTDKTLKEVELISGAYMLVICEIKNYSKITCDLEDQGYIIHPYISYQTDKGQKMIVMVQEPHLKPMTENIIEFGCGAVNIDKCRVLTNEHLGRPQAKQQNSEIKLGLKNNGVNETSDLKGGRFPANLIHNGKIDNHFEKQLKGSSSRFFKTCQTEKELIKYLTKLIKPIGKTIKVDV